VTGWTILLVTQDGGLHWSRPSLPGAGLYPDYLAAFGSTVVLVEDGRVIYVSGDAGADWRLAYADSGGAGSAAIWVLAGSDTWIQLSTTPGSISVWQTTDGGTVWTQSTGHGPTDRHVMAASFVSATDGWAIFQRDLTCPQVGALCPSIFPWVRSYELPTAAEAGSRSL
jgi:photosystem II stability/assembly factor-like uncharacterized protein